MCSNRIWIFIFGQTFSSLTVVAVSLIKIAAALVTQTAEQQRIGN
jgi:hypothetical protein